MNQPFFTYAWVLVAGCFGYLLGAFLSRARDAEDRKPSTTPTPGENWERRLLACEHLGRELTESLAAIEARDKMRQVRAARTAKQELAAASNGSGETPEPQKLSTAELRRMIAAGKRPT